MIIVSDGLCYEMKNEEAVMLAGKWLDSKAKREFSVEEVAKQGTIPQRTNPPLSQNYTRPKGKINEGSITVVDDNAATHLVGNALEGANEDLFRGILTFRAPFARYVR